MEETDAYRPRIIDREIDKALSEFGAVLVKGPKWCGKTTSSERHAKSMIYLNDPDEEDRYAEIAEIKVSNLLIGDNPRLIDEWQMIPKLWDAVRFDVDRRKKSGLYIMTGSTHVDYSKVKHTGTGRIKTLMMRPMSLFESGDSNGSVSLSSLFATGTEVEGVSDMDYSSLARVIIRGGWPMSVLMNSEGSSVIAGYCESIIESEVRIGSRKRDKEKLRRILRSLSRNVAMSVSNSKILEDMTDDEPDAKAPMDDDTLSDYLGYLEQICVIEDMDAWKPKLRSQVPVRTSKTRHFVDPSIAAYFLGASARDLEFDPETFGLLFESLVVRDLRVYAQGIGGRVYHYRDKNGLEVDSIVHLWDGRWGAIEVKLSAGKVDDAVRSLTRLKEKVDVEERNKLSFLAVIVGTGYAYTRPDGIHVIPIGCLRD